MNTIYIGNLSADVSEAALVKIFEKFGKVNGVDIIVDSFSGNKLGFGFAHMPGANQAKEAVKAINHTSICGRTVIASLTTARKERRKAVMHKELANV